jgi:acetoin utilization deacetylase AcuC-like enzyme
MRREILAFLAVSAIGVPQREGVLPSLTARSDNDVIQALAGPLILPLPMLAFTPIISSCRCRRVTVFRCANTACCVMRWCVRWAVELREAPRADDETLALAHTAAYIEEVSTGQLDAARQREIGFPWSHEMVERSRRSAGATIAAWWRWSRVSRRIWLAARTTPTPTRAGFCVFNDAAIAARRLQRDGSVRRVAVIDLDVHQGNGTASILRDDPTIFTLSLHGEKNYPFRKEASDLDVGLPDGCDDGTYAVALASALDTLFARFARSADLPGRRRSS